MSVQRWEIYDTATGETDHWDLVRPLEQSATLEEAAANISDSALAADGYHPTDANCWKAWGFEPVSWNNETMVLTASTCEESVWGDGHTLTATLVECHRSEDVITEGY